jgi:acyl-[acyl-carrier-protein] desaturase
MLTGQVDHRLERKLIELYTQHKERSARIDWSYHDFLPLQREDLFHAARQALAAQPRN